MELRGAERKGYNYKWVVQIWRQQLNNNKKEEINSSTMGVHAENRINSCCSAMGFPVWKYRLAWNFKNKIKAS